MKRTLSFLGLFLFTLSAFSGFAQTDTIPPASVDPELLAIFEAKIPRKYTIADIKVTGNVKFDAAIVISVSGLSVGDEVTIPGGDNFAKAINKLWAQNMFTNINIFITKLEDRNIWVEIVAQERPMLSDFRFSGIRKGEAEELKDKVGLFKSRVVTDNMRLSALEAISKYYTEKGFQGAETKIKELPDPNAAGRVILEFQIDKGNKVRIDQVHFFGNNSVEETKLKKKMKGTKERMRFTLQPDSIWTPYGQVSGMSARQFVQEKKFLIPTQTLQYLEPWFRFRFGSAKFNDKKYREDKEKVLEYYNSIGYRDAVIASDTQYYDRKGNLNVALKVDEGKRYYFGNMTWKGNTKYPDSILNMLLGIRKGEIYNIETLNKKLGKQLSQEGGDISSLYMDNGYLFFQIDPVETSVYNDTIDHEIRIMEGPQATIKNIKIEGNDKTREYVIRREIRTLPGEKFSRSDIIRTQRELSQLGYFNQEKIGINPVPNQEDGTVDINY